MSRKDYIKMAELLRAYKERLPRKEFDDLVTDVAMLFKRDNERFSAIKFGQYIYGRSGETPDEGALTSATDEPAAWEQASCGELGSRREVSNMRIQHGPVCIDNLGKLLYVVVDSVELIKVHDLQESAEVGDDLYERCITVTARDGTIVTLVFGAERPDQLVLTAGGSRRE
jgi:hypothetical protein